MMRHAHLIGSVGLKDAETVFTTINDILGDSCISIPDGETGARGYWIRWQEKTFAGHPDLDMQEVDVKIPGFKDAVKRPFFRVKEGVDPAMSDFGELGYAREAIASYGVFSNLVAQGRLPADKLFQVSVPTPMVLLCGFVVMEDRLKLEPAIEAAMKRDVEQIHKAIASDKLAMQWDVCYEIVGADGGPSLPYDDAIQGSVERVARLCGYIDEGVRLGIHLCYGDPGHQHIVEPGDLGTSVAFANGICEASLRRIDFMHMPIPRNRGDDGYFKPLEELNMPVETRLILGLVHHTDGVEGSNKRIAAAQRYVEEFDIATECGFGRRDPETISGLLSIHKALCG